MSEFKSLGDIGNEIAREVVARINAPPDLAVRPIVEQIAMLMMMDARSTGEERHVAIGKLIDSVHDKPAWTDFAVLVADGICAKKPGEILRGESSAPALLPRIQPASAPGRRAEQPLRDALRLHLRGQHACPGAAQCRPAGLFAVQQPPAEY